MSIAQESMITKPVKRRIKRTPYLLILPGIGWLFLFFLFLFEGWKVLFIVFIFEPANVRILFIFARKISK